MHIYDTANKLASEIKNSKEYLEYKRIKDEVYNNIELKEKMEKFTKLRYEIQVEQIQAKEENKTKVTDIEIEE